MKLSAREVKLPLAEPFVIARAAYRETSVVEVRVDHDELSGFGEAAPIARYGESAESALAWLADVELEDDPWDMQGIHERMPPGQQAARAAVESAVFDLQGKLTGLPLHRLLGLRAQGPPTSWTVWIGDPDDMAQRAERAIARGFRRLKLKLGGRDGLDLERVLAVTSVTSAPIQVDVNEYWAFEEALELLPQMPIAYCEQPLAANDQHGPELKRRSPVPIYLDEDCHTLADIPRCAEAAHGVTLKLAKSGGVREAIRMVDASRALGLGVMLGCMVESGLGIAPAVHIASLCDHVDLDGNLLIARDPWRGITFENGVQHPSAGPGLGVVPA